MRTAFAAALVIVASFSVSNAARATDMDNFRWDEFRGNCRVVEIHTVNRWGDDVTTHTRVCG